MSEKQIGAFLIRNSKTIPGDVVLCVRYACLVRRGLFLRVAPVRLEIVRPVLTCQLLLPPAPGTRPPTEKITK